MKNINRSKGLTLIEMLVFIVVLGVSIIPLMSIFSSSLRAGVDNLIEMNLIYLAEGKMEEMIAWDFFTLENMDTYGDLGTPRTGNFQAPLDQYSFSIWALPINPDYANNLADSAALAPNHSLNYVGGNFLRIHVRVTHTNGNSIDLWTVKTPSGQKEY